MNNFGETKVSPNKLNICTVQIFMPGMQACATSKAQKQYHRTDKNSLMQSLHLSHSFKEIAEIHSPQQVSNTKVTATLHLCHNQE